MSSQLTFNQLHDRMAFCDPSSGRAQIKKLKARSAIVVVAQDYLERVFVLHAWADRVPTDTLYEKIYEVNERFEPRLFGIEANGLQSLFGDGIRREARMRQLQPIPLHSVFQPTNLEKPFRNRSAIQPVIAQGRLFVQPSQIELTNELAVHPMSPICDLVDALASAISLLPRRPAAMRADGEIHALARYLRSTGAPPWVIEQRINELRTRRAKLPDEFSPK